MPPVPLNDTRLKPNQPSVLFALQPREAAMAHYTIVTLIASGAITYLYNEANRALAKVRTLQRQAKRFRITDDHAHAELTPSELEQRAFRTG